MSQLREEANKLASTNSKLETVDRLNFDLRKENDKLVSEKGEQRSLSYKYGLLSLSLGNPPNGGGGCLR